MFPLGSAFRGRGGDASEDDGDVEEKGDEYGDGGSDDQREGYAIPQPKLQVTHDGQLEEKLLVRTEGWMYKKGGAVNQRLGRKNWKKRWFILSTFDFRGQTGYELQYFDRPNGSLKGSVGLMDVVIFCEARTKHHKIKYEFQLNLPNGGTLELSCDDDKEREEWIETLNMVIAFMRTLTHPVAMVLNGYDPLDEDDVDVYEMGQQIALNCQAFGPGLYGAEAGKREQFVLQIYDVEGMQVTRGGMPVTCTISNEDLLYYVKVLDNNDGTFSAYYMLGTPGKYKLSIRLNDEHEIHGSPFDIEILPSKTVASCSTAEGEALTSVYPEEISTFTVIARDALGNAKTRGGDPFEVSILGPAKPRSVEDNEDGTYTVTFEAQDPSKAQYYAANTLQINVSLYGKPIAQSPFRPIILEAPPQSNYGAYTQSAEELREAEERRRQLFSGDDDDDDDVDAASAQQDAARLNLDADADASGRPEQVPVAPPQPRRASQAPEDIASVGNSSLDRVKRARERALQKRQTGASGTSGADAGVDSAAVPVRKGSIASASLGNVSATASVLSPADEATLKAQFQQGLPGAFNAATDDDRLFWGLLSGALASPGVIELLTSNLKSMKQAFDLLSETIDGYRVIKLPGVKRLLQELGVTPLKCTERDAQLAFTLMQQAQSNGAVPAASILGGTVLDFAHFVKFLAGLCILSVAKNATLHAEYNSLEVNLPARLFHLLSTGPPLTLPPTFTPLHSIPLLSTLTGQGGLSHDQLGLWGPHQAGNPQEQSQGPGPLSRVKCKKKCLKRDSTRLS